MIFANLIYFRYFSTVLSVSLLGNIVFFKNVISSIFVLSRSKDLILLFDIPLIVIFFIAKYKWVDPSIILKNQIRILSSIFFILALTSFTFAYSRIEKFELLYDNNYIASKYGLLYYNAFDLKRFVSNELFKDRTLNMEEKEKLNTFFAKRPPQTKNAYSDTGTGKNLIIIQVEALQSYVIHKTIGGIEITPHLNSLVNKGIYFPNFYAQVSTGNTSDAEFLANASLYPLRNKMVYFSNPLNNYFGAPKMLKKEGYQSFVFHAYNPSFYNRPVMYNSLGFDRFYSSLDFVQDDLLGWGVSDISFFKQSMEKLDTSKPFYSLFTTLSSHYPFDMFRNYPFPVGKYEGSMLGDYLKSMNYLDTAIGILIDELHKKNIFHNSILAIYGDHQGIPIESSDHVLEFLNVPVNTVQKNMLRKVPFIIYSTETEHKIIENIGGQIDILPTIANIMGFYNPYWLGRDLLGSNDSFALLRDGSVITDTFMYVGSLYTLFDYDGNVLEKESYLDFINEKQEILSISDIIINKNAFKP
jgi:lipoteichoic acid synthase